MQTSKSKRAVSVTENQSGSRPKKSPTAAYHTELWNPVEAAAWCGFKSPITILRKFRSGELPGYKLNRRTIRFAPEDIKRWIADAKVGGILKPQKEDPATTEVKL